MGFIGEMFKKIFFPKPIARTAEWLEKYGDSFQKISLNVKPGCPYCILVKREIHRLSLPIKIIDIDNDRVRREEQMTGGGKRQVPCLRTEKGPENIEWMYESDLIINHLREQYPD